MDIKTAFLYREITKDVYIKLPHRFTKEGVVYKLNRPLSKRIRSKYKVSVVTRGELIKTIDGYIKEPLVELILEEI